YFQSRLHPTARNARASGAPALTALEPVKGKVLPRCSQISVFCNECSPRLTKGIETLLTFSLSVVSCVYNPVLSSHSQAGLGAGAGRMVAQSVGTNESHSFSGGTGRGDADPG